MLNSINTGWTSWTQNSGMRPYLEESALALARSRALRTWPCAKGYLWEERHSKMCEFTFGLCEKKCAFEVF